MRRHRWLIAGTIILVILVLLAKFWDTTRMPAIIPSQNVNENTGEIVLTAANAPEEGYCPGDILLYKQTYSVNRHFTADITTQLRRVPPEGGKPLPLGIEPELLRDVFLPGNYIDIRRYFYIPELKPGSYSLLKTVVGDEVRVKYSVLFNIKKGCPEMSLGRFMGYP